MVTDPAAHDSDAGLERARRLARLQFLLVRLSRAVDGAMREGAGRLGLTPVQAEALRFAGTIRPDVATVGQLARVLGVRHPTVLGVLRPLVERGLIERRPHPYDARQHSLALTDAGRALLSRLDAIEEDLALVVGGLDEAELAGLEQGLAGLVREFTATGSLVIPAPCPGCVHFEEQAAPDAAAPHYCRLIRRYLSPEEVAMPCPEHSPAQR